MNINNNQAGKNAKHKNHTVPLALLKRWLVKKNSGESGYWVLFCNPKSDNYVVWHNNPKANFAIREFLYVPVRINQPIAYRDEFLEDWFGSGESDLASVTDKILADKISEIKLKSLGGFLQASILLGYRSGYELDLVEQQMRRQNPGFDDNYYRRRAIDAFQILYSSKLRQFINWNFKFIETETPLLICDRPFDDMTLGDPRVDCVYMPITPNLLFMGWPPEDPTRKDPHIHIGIYKDKTSVADKANKMTSDRAREFIVGSKEQLENLVSHFCPAKFQERKNKDRWVGAVNLPLS